MSLRDHLRLALARCNAGEDVSAVAQALGLEERDVRNLLRAPERVDHFAMEIAARDWPPPKPTDDAPLTGAWSVFPHLRTPEQPENPKTPVAPPNDVCAEAPAVQVTICPPRYALGALRSVEFGAPGDGRSRRIRGRD